ncbi:MAG: hypothetical protein M3R51_08770 [Candidatus Eremiobacteraeota bacterium]|nr:hypothetical protein [Candidatus Eremiobacteraeota bacterium]
MWIVPGKLGERPVYGQADFTLEQRRNRWLDIVSGQEAVDAPIRITQDATFSVTRLDDAELVRDFTPKRFAFIFVADGTAQINGETLHKGDAIRCFGVSQIAAKGHAELILWDLPRISLG